MAVYVIIFILLALLAIDFELNTFRYKSDVLMIIFVLLTFFVGFRSELVDRDYVSYLTNFYVITHYEDYGGTGVLPIFEPGFVLIVKLCNYVFLNNYVVAVMTVFAFLSLGLKFFVIKKLSYNPFLVILLYFSYFFIYQEMTQIRNGLACSLFFVAVMFYLENKKHLTILCILLAIAFHQSAILYFFIFLLDTKSFNKYKYVSLFLAGVLLGIIRLPIVGLLSSVDLGEVSNKLATYKQLTEVGFVDDVNFLNVINLFSLAITAYLIFCVIKQKLQDTRLILFLKFNIISIFIFGFLVDFSSIAFRITELFWVFFIFLFAYLSKLLPFKSFNIYFVVGVAAIYFYINIFHVKLLQPYVFSFFE
jgi:hypothetical protein